MSKNSQLKNRVGIIKKEILSSKKRAIIALVMMLTLAVPLITSIQSVYAADIQTYPGIACYPNPVGIGQTMNIATWLEPYPATANDRYHNFTLTITDPDGIIQTSIFLLPIRLEEEGHKSYLEKLALGIFSSVILEKLSAATIISQALAQKSTLLYSRSQYSHFLKLRCQQTTGHVPYLQRTENGGTSQEIGWDPTVKP